MIWSASREMRPSQEERLFTGDTVSFLRITLAYNMSVFIRVLTESWILEKVLKFAQQFSRVKSWKNGKKSGVFFQSYNKCFTIDFFSFWSNLIQFRPYVCSASCKKLCSRLLMNYLITLSLEKKLLFWKKVWKKSRILDPNICTKPVSF